MIEFHCPHCDKFLATTEEKAGWQSTCPGCGQTIVVPGPAAATSSPADDIVEDFDEVGYETVEPEADLDLTKPCPMCGATIKAAAIKCRYCGEEFGSPATTGTQDGTIVPTQIAIGDVMSSAWTIFKGQMGLCIAAVLVAILVYIALQFALQLGFVGMSLVLDQVGDAAVGIVLMVLFVGVFYIAILALQTLLTIGMLRIMLTIARGREPSLGVLFTGGRWLITALLANIVIGIFSTLLTYAPLMAIMGLAAVIDLPMEVAFVIAIPLAIFIGLWIMITVSMVPMLIIDQNAGVIESIRLSIQITNGNRLQLLALSLIGIVLYLLGFIACVVGLLIAAPYIVMIYTVAYLRMTGQASIA